MRKAVLFLTFLVFICAIATTASAAFGGPGPTPSATVTSFRITK